MRASPVVGRTRAVQASGNLHPLWIALLLMTVVSISRIHAYYLAIARLRPALVLFVFAVGYAVLQSRVVTPQNVVRTWPGKVILGLGGLACLSALFGISLGGSAEFITEDYAKTIIYTCTVIMAFRDWRDVRRLMWAYVLGAGILVWLSLFVFGISKTSRGLTYDANDTGLVLLVALPFALLLVQTSRWRGRLISGTILVGIVVTIARSSSRGAFVGLMLVGLATLVSLKSVSITKRALVVIGAAGVLTLGAPEGYWNLISTLRDPQADYNWSARDGRKEIAKRGIGYMVSYPMFGIGIANYPRAEGTISEKTASMSVNHGVRWAAAHNSFVQVGAEMGIPGLILWSSIIVGGIVGCRRLRKRMPREWRNGTEEQRFLYLATMYLPMALVGFAVTAFFVSFAYMDPIYVLAALLSGLYVAVRASTRATSPRPTAVSVRRARPLAVKQSVLVPDPR